MPLVWAHAEYVKLRRSLEDGRVFDTPPQTVRRYIEGKTGSPYAAWKFNHKLRSIPSGKTLRIETQGKATVRWTADNWDTTQDSFTEDTGLGLHVADLATKDLEPGRSIAFTFYWSEAARWESENYEVKVTK
jgi:glucoamylase